DFVQSWCNQHNIPCFLLHAKVESQHNIQEQARDIRYQWFQQLIEQQGLKYVATAHHADDNAETILMNLSRGTGIKGLHGILPQQGNIIRPLLVFSALEIQRFATDEQLTFRNDS